MALWGYVHRCEFFEQKTSHFHLRCLICLSWHCDNEEVQRWEGNRVDLDALRNTGTFLFVSLFLHTFGSRSNSHPYYFSVTFCSDSFVSWLQGGFMCTVWELGLHDDLRHKSHREVLNFYCRFIEVFLAFV